jgi:hypothetical protein
MISLQRRSSYLAVFMRLPWSRITALRQRDLGIGVFALAAFCACASTRGSSGTTPRTNRDLITREQIQDHRFHNAYEAVEALHSNWLQTRGTDSFNAPSQVRVYLDNVLLGGVETLRAIEIANIVYIQHYDAVSATARWGLNHGQGVIFISTRPADTDPPRQ